MLLGLTVLLGTSALADDLSREAPRQKEVAAVMDVLRVSGTDPSPSCLSALDDMNTTDRQLAQLNDAIAHNNETEPVVQHQSGEVSVARDVLASDIEAVLGSCRPDADHACVDRSSASLSTACARLRTAVDTEHP